jgi:hypothetical protein
MLRPGFPASKRPKKKPAKQGDVVQQRTKPSLVVTLRGYGVRVGKHVPYPAIASHAGRPAVPIQPQVFLERCLNLCGSPSGGTGGCSGTE